VGVEPLLRGVLDDTLTLPVIRNLYHLVGGLVFRVDRSESLDVFGANVDLLTRSHSKCGLLSSSNIDRLFLRRSLHTVFSHGRVEDLCLL